MSACLAVKGHFYMNIFKKLVKIILGLGPASEVLRAYFRLCDQESLLAGSRGPYVVLGLEPICVRCKAVPYQMYYLPGLLDYNFNRNKFSFESIFICIFLFVCWFWFGAMGTGDPEGPGYQPSGGSALVSSDWF